MGRKANVKQLVIISGKGGTGKTSLVACFAALAQDKVLADCDVDAADLHLILSPTVRKEEFFHGTPRFTVNQEKCVRCEKCLPLCRFGAIEARRGEDGELQEVTIDPVSCEGCRVCAYLCPAEAIEQVSKELGRWFLSDTRHGPMVHARLGIAEENSGKLVTIVRTEARRIAEEEGFELIIVDGPPGIGCPVIASITGANLVLVVTEPTLSARHDLERAVALVANFGIQAAACVNKCDLNPGIVAEIRDWCSKNAAPVIGEVPYDPAFTRAQMRGESIVEHSHGPAAIAVREVWSRLADLLERQGNGGRLP